MRQSHTFVIIIIIIIIIIIYIIIIIKVQLGLYDTQQTPVACKRKFRTCTLWNAMHIEGLDNFTANKV